MAAFVSDGRIPVFGLEILFLLFMLTVPAAAAQSLKDYCSASFFENGECPQTLCKPGCVYLPQTGDRCLPGCVPKPCVEIETEHCPARECQIIQGCTGEQVCYYQMKETPPACGRTGYNGQDAQCCEGLIRRCGLEFFDGSCDLKGAYSSYVAPVCIPCGNGICDQFENRCNCPEDCAY